MDIKGQIRIEVKDANTLKVKRVIEKENVVTDRAYAYILNATGQEYILRPLAFHDRRISLSTNTAQPRRDNQILSNVIATGFVASDVTSPVFFKNANPVYGEIRNRILFVGYPRSFQTVGLTNLAPSNASANISGELYAYTLLDEPCIQEYNEVLDIFYRILFPVPDNATFAKRAYVDLGQCSFYIPNVGPFYNPGDRGYYWVDTATASYADPPASPYLELWRGFHPHQEAGDDPNYYDHQQQILARSRTWSGNYTNWNSRDIIWSHWKRKFVQTFNKDEFVGRLVNSIMTGCSTNGSGVLNDTDVYSAYAIDKFLPAENNKLQSVFSHSADTLVPFHEPQKLASSSLKPVLSGTWNGTWPDLFRIQVTQSGALGVGKYKWLVRRHLGFRNNSYIDQWCHIPFRHPQVKPFNNAHGWRTSDKEVQKLDERTIVQYDSNGVSILDIFNGAYKTYDSETSPALGVTNISQIAVDKFNKIIYVACRDTGLYKIDIQTNIVTKLEGTACYGVSIGRAGLVYALFNGRLSNNNDWSAALPITYTGITDGNWNKVNYIKADTINTENRLALIYDRVKVAWWKGDGTVAVGPVFSNDINDYRNNVANPRLLDFSEVAGVWVACTQVYYSNNDANNSYRYWNVYKLFYGSAAADRIFAAEYGDDFGPPWGSVQFNEYGHLIGRSAHIDVAGSTGFRGAKLSIRVEQTHNGEMFTYMGRGLNFYGTFLCYPMYNRINIDGTVGIEIVNPVYYDSYGWDGTNWVKEPWTWTGTAWTKPDVGSRTSHLNTQALGYGLSIEWQELSPGQPQPLVAGQYYTQGACNGRWKANDNNLTWKLNWYVKPTYFNQPLSNTVPTSAPYAVVVSKSPFGGSDPDTTWAHIENDEPDIHNIQISGYPTSVVAKYSSYDSNVPPGPNEVYINGYTGILTFNPTDAGKNVTGTYMYIGGADTRPNVSSNIVYPSNALYRSDIGISGDQAQWNDQSGKGKHALQTDVNKRPTVVIEDLNNKNVLDFDGVNDSYLLPTATLDVSKGWVGVFIVKFDSVAGYQTIFDACRSSNAGAYNLLCKDNNNQIYFYTDRNADGYSWVLNSSLTVTAGQYYIISCLINPYWGKILVRVNRTNYIESNIPTDRFPYSQAFDRTSIGIRGYHQTEALNGKMAWASLHEGIFSYQELYQLENLASSTFNI